MTRNGCILLASSPAEAIEWANRIAPEHLMVDPFDLTSIQNAGSIFVGEFSAQAAGDYASGPNHVLPTAGVARFSWWAFGVGLRKDHHGAGTFRASDSKESEER